MHSRLIVFALVLGLSVNAAETHTTVPSQFRGTWAADAAHCGALGAESKLTIHETSIDFYESRGRILAIATDGARELALLIEATGEGQTWLDARQFMLSEDGQSLTDVTGRRRTTIRIRCEPGA